MVCLLAWARQLLQKLEGPMSHFQNTYIVSLPESRRIVKAYNSIARALVQFEDVWYNGWCEAVAAARDGMLATLLVLSSPSCC